MIELSKNDINLKTATNAHTGKLKSIDLTASAKDFESITKNIFKQL